MSIQNILSQLEGTLSKKNELFGQNLRISEKSKEEELDDLFLMGLGTKNRKSQKFEIQNLIKDLDILDDQYLGQDTQTTEMLKSQQNQMQSAVQRLNKYIGSLKMHILEIVQCESDEFLKLADRLASFNQNFQQVKFQNSEVQRVAGRIIQSQLDAMNYLQQELLELQAL